MPAELLDRFADDSGLGISTRPEDQQMPMAVVLQSNSPVVDRRSEAYLDGAEAGLIWLRNTADPFHESIGAIPCGMRTAWVEWLQNRQGYVARHDQLPEDATAVPSTSGRRRPVLVRNGGETVIEETRELFILVGGQPFMLPCSSTKNSFAKRWQTYFHQFRHPRTGSILPSFSRKYRLFTVPVSNQLGRWFGLEFADLGWIATQAEYDAARAFALIIAGGGGRSAYQSQDDAA
jgi:hypothetical protein